MSQHRTLAASVVPDVYRSRPDRRRRVNGSRTRRRVPRPLRATSRHGFPQRVDVAAPGLARRGSIHRAAPACRPAPSARHRRGVFDLGALVGGIERQIDEPRAQGRQIKHQAFRRLLHLDRNARSRRRPQRYEPVRDAAAGVLRGRATIPGLGVSMQRGRGPPETGVRPARRSWNYRSGHDPSRTA